MNGPATFVVACALAALGCGEMLPSAPGTLRVEEAPPDTVLFVDARVVGRATAMMELPLAAGHHMIEARRDTAVVAFASVDVAPAAIVSVRLVAVDAPPAEPVERLPTPPVEPVALVPAPASPAPGLSASSISSVVSAHRRELMRCYERSLREGAEGTNARITVDVEIAPDGSVASVELSGSAGTSVDTCIRRAVRGWRFEPPGSVTNISFPVVFTSG